MSEQIDRIDAQQKTNTANIADLIRLSENLLSAVERNIEATERNAAAIERNEVAVSEANDRFNILIQEMRSDRQASQQAFSEADDRFNILIQEMRSDRQTSQQAFQSLLSQLTNINERVDDVEQA